MYKLSDAELAMLADLQRDIENIQEQQKGAFRLMLKTRGLVGHYILQGDELVEAK